MSNLMEPKSLDPVLLARDIGQTKIDYCEILHKGSSLFRHVRGPSSSQKLHRFNSITKSVLSLLIGIALERGELPGLHDPIETYFPKLDLSGKREVTLEHLLTMTPGWDWPEMGAWGGLPTPMTDSPDWVRYVLSRPMKHKPGKRMCYDSGSSHLLSAILQATTGLSSAEYARRHLFEPIGIERFRWGSDTNGIVIGGFGLELAPPDLAKLGQLMLNRGLWQGRRIVSEEWIAASTSARYHTYDHIGSYGYHWWVLPQDEESDRPAVYFAMGYGGQYLFIVPRLELVVVFASTLYKRTFFPYRLFKKWLNLEEDKPSALLSKR